GGFLDSIGGGGWGPVVTSTLLVRGNEARKTIGSVNASEFFIALSSSATFFLSGTAISWKIVAALALGGAVAAPLGALICKFMPTKRLLLIVGLLIIALNLSYVYTLFFKGPL